MKTKLFFASIFLTAFLFLNFNYKNIYQHERQNQWLDYHKLRIENFTDTTFLGNVKQFEFIYENFEEQNDLFEEFFIYSSDSSCYLDLYSYSLILEKQPDNSILALGIEPDSEVGLVRIKEKQKIRIHFCGTICWIEEAEWIDNENIHLFGFSKENNITVPTIWKYNLKSKEKITVKTKHNIKASLGGYLVNVRMKKIRFL
jgi:hypothetical protein